MFSLPYENYSKNKDVVLILYQKLLDLAFSDTSTVPTAMLLAVELKQVPNFQRKQYADHITFREILENSAHRPVYESP